MKPSKSSVAPLKSEYLSQKYPSPETLLLNLPHLSKIESLFFVGIISDFVAQNRDLVKKYLLQAGAPVIAANENLYLLLIQTIFRSYLDSIPPDRDLAQLAYLVLLSPQLPQGTFDDHFLKYLASNHKVDEDIVISLLKKNKIDDDMFARPFKNPANIRTIINYFLRIDKQLGLQEPSPHSYAIYMFINKNKLTKSQVAYWCQKLLLLDKYPDAKNLIAFRLESLMENHKLSPSAVTWIIKNGDRRLIYLLLQGNQLLTLTNLINLWQLDKTSSGQDDPSITSHLVQKFIKTKEYQLFLKSNNLNFVLLDNNQMSLSWHKARIDTMLKNLQKTVQ